MPNFLKYFTNYDIICNIQIYFSVFWGSKRQV